MHHAPLGATSCQARGAGEQEGLRGAGQEQPPGLGSALGDGRDGLLRLPLSLSRGLLSVISAFCAARRLQRFASLLYRVCFESRSKSFHPAFLNDSTIIANTNQSGALRSGQRCLFARLLIFPVVRDRFLLTKAAPESLSSHCNAVTPDCSSCCSYLYLKATPSAGRALSSHLLSSSSQTRFFMSLFKKRRGSGAAWARKGCGGEAMSERSCLAHALHWPYAGL